MENADESSVISEARECLLGVHSDTAYCSHAARSQRSFIVANVKLYDAAAVPPMVLNSAF